MNSVSALVPLLAFVAERTGLSPAESAEAVVRVDVHRERGICVELDAPRLARRWFRADASGLWELLPHEDDRLPLCATLARGEQPVAWRPGRRIVLAAGGGDFAKGYRRRRVVAAARVHAALHDVAMRSGALRTPAVRGVDEELETMTLERLDGAPVVLSPAGADVFFTLGEGLRALQQSDPGTALPRFGVEDELGVLDVWRDKAVQALGGVPGGWDALLLDVRRLAAGLGTLAPVISHRDLHDGQLLDLGARVGVLDFDLACLANPMLDVANLLAHMELRLIQGLAGASRPGVDACSEALFEGYGDVHGDAWPHLRLYQATAFLRLALVYALRPRWRHLSEELVRYGKRCLADLVRIA